MFPRPNVGPSVAVTFSCLLHVVAVTIATAQPLQPSPGAEDVQKGLTEGFRIGSKNLQSANGRFDSARRAAAGDPRIDYAQGLVLAKQVQWSAAQSQFEHGTNRPGQPYWPVWQAWVWCAFRDKQPEQGFTRLVDMSKRIAAQAKAVPLAKVAPPVGLKPVVIQVGAAQPATARLPTAEIQAAKSLGRLIAAATLFDTTVKLKLVRARSLIQMQDLLGDELYAAVEAGQDEFDAEQEENLEQAIETADAKSKREQQVTEVEQAKLEGSLTKAAIEKAETKKSAEEWKKWLDTEIETIDKDLKALEKDYKFGQQRADSLTESIRIVGQELTLLSANEPRVNSPLRGNWENQYVSRQGQLSQYQGELTNTSQALAELARQGSIKVAIRIQTTQQYEQATGTLLDRSSDLDNWSKRLASKMTKLQVKAAKPVNPEPPTSFTSYLPLELEAERDRVLSDLGVAVKPAKP